MAVWLVSVDLKDVWEGDEDFPGKRNAIIHKIRESGWRKITEDVRAFDTLLDALSETEDVRGFDRVFNGLYDLADRDRVWIGTF